MVGKPEVNRVAPGFKVPCESSEGFVTRSKTSFERQLRVLLTRKATLQ
jgi:hypothetical protein